MDDICFHCGGAVEGDGIEHRGKVFCSDECCDEFEDELTTNGEPDPDDLDDEDFEVDDLEFDEDAENFDEDYDDDDLDDRDF
jgi:hypothetical protein